MDFHSDQIIVHGYMSQTCNIHCGQCLCKVSISSDHLAQCYNNSATMVCNPAHCCAGPKSRQRRKVCQMSVDALAVKKQDDWNLMHIQKNRNKCRLWRRPEQQGPRPQPGTIAELSHWATDRSEWRKAVERASSTYGQWAHGSWWWWWWKDRLG